MKKNTIKAVLHHVYLAALGSTIVTALIVFTGCGNETNGINSVDAAGLPTESNSADSTSPVDSEDSWMRFRGPNASGVIEATGLPVEWDSAKNIVWNTELPGPGSSSPIVVNNKVYLTCYSGYAESTQDPGNKADLVRHVICLDRKTGDLVWKKDFKAKMPESDYSGGNNTRHGYATSTIASDGSHLYVFFGISGVFALDLDGNQLWHADVGSGTDGWGTGTSSVLYENLVIVNASIESSSLVALNKETGDRVWRVNGIERCWSSPILVNANGRTELVLSAPEKLAAYNPATGDEYWYCEGVSDGYICPTPVSHDGVIYAIGGRRSAALAVRAGGSGNVSDSHVLWREDIGSNVSSPVYLDEYLYFFHESRGSVYCLNAKTGQTVYEEALDPRPGLVYSSPSVADGKIYVNGQEDGTYVLAASPEFKQLARNRFENDRSRVNSCVTVDKNQLLLRTDKAIYCIGN